MPNACNLAKRLELGVLLYDVDLSLLEAFFMRENFSDPLLAADLAPRFYIAEANPPSWAIDENDPAGSEFLDYSAGFVFSAALRIYF